MAAPKHTPEQKARALELYASVGASAASRETGISVQTISSWARRLGVRTYAEATVSAATRMSVATREERKARLAERLLGVAEEEIDRLRKPVTEHRVSASGKLIEWQESEPSPQDRKAIIGIAQVAIDKSQLLAGDATSRSEVLTGEDQRQRISEMRDELAEKRRRKQEGAA